MFPSIPYSPSLRPLSNPSPSVHGDEMDFLELGLTTHQAEHQTRWNQTSMAFSQAEEEGNLVLQSSYGRQLDDFENNRCMIGLSSPKSLFDGCSSSSSVSSSPMMRSAKDSPFFQPSSATSVCSSPASSVFSPGSESSSPTLSSLLSSSLKRPNQWKQEEDDDTRKKHQHMVDLVL